MYLLYTIAHLVLMTHFLLIYFYFCIDINVQKNTFEKLNNARMAAKMNILSITDAFDDYESMEALLRRLGLSTRCITRFMDEEGF